MLWSAQVVARCAASYIGVCYGPPGVGKTQSARPYANSDELEPALRTFKFYDSDVAELDLDARTIVYTPKVHNTPRIVDKEVRYLQDRLGWLIEFEIADNNFKLSNVGTSGQRLVELLIVDEADRLKTRASSSCAITTTAPASA